ncbi:hypothetical protein AVEN_125859-1 [Araneus ventricosus]|uniref:Uncharacterized protein n=1 Tax=Araneus ventricosus TaxID=182803 RepID=A0A4Y2IZT7_ARAVE|nr:hypothetical protein AVEN_125859-1 [Araneus ventricosus]
MLGSIISYHCSGLVARSRLRDSRFLGSKPDSTEEPPCKLAWCTQNPSESNLLHLLCFGSLKRGVSFSLYDHGSKLQVLFPNSPIFVSKRDTNVTKLNSYQKIIYELFEKC